MQKNTDMSYNLENYLFFSTVIAVGLMVWDTIEVGRNDATNVINAVFGARVLSRKKAVAIAGIAVILGAWASSPVLETARKGIFDPSLLTSEEAVAVYLSVYLTDTVLLYSFSAFGLPISTTAGLVAALIGGGLAMGGPEIVHWEKNGDIFGAIGWSFAVSGIAAFVIQRVFRRFIGPHCEDPAKVRQHGPWVAGLLLTGLGYFILMKGMQHVSVVKALRASLVDSLGMPLFLLALWFVISVMVGIVLYWGGAWIQRRLFAGLAIAGMLSIAFAFGQNDLCNGAAPGIAVFMIWKHGDLGSSMDVPSTILLFSGTLLFLGMTTKKAQRVTRAEVNTGSQGDVVRLYAPQWCIWIARIFVKERHPEQALAPEPEILPGHKIQHYDALRAAVITSVSGCTIALASGMGLPVSTTYVSFICVVATGWADRIFQRGDADLKLGRTIWVVFGWLFSAFLAAFFTGLCALFIHTFHYYGVMLCLAANLTVRAVANRRSNAQEQRLLEEAAERKQRLFEQRGIVTTMPHETDMV